MDIIIKEQYYKIFLDGEQFSPYLLKLISSVSLEDKSNGSDLLHIEMNDPDYRLIEDSLFLEDKPIWFEGGWKNEIPITFGGFISVIDMNFPEDGIPKIVIHCMDNSHVMNRENKKRTWENTKASSVASGVFAEHGLVPVVDATPIVEEKISQSNESDIAFLINLAKDQDDDYLCYVEGNKGYFVKRDILKTPKRELEYRKGQGNLLSFSPRINKESKQLKIDKSDIDDKGKEKKDVVTNESTRELQGDNKNSRSYLGGSTWSP